MREVLSLLPKKTTNARLKISEAVDHIRAEYNEISIFILYTRLRMHYMI